MAFGSAWLWNHDELKGPGAAIHTIVCGAARPADLDQPAVAASLQGTDPTKTLARVKSVVGRLEKASKEAHDEDWLKTCYEGIPKSNVSKYCVEHNQIVWCYNLIKSYGLLAFSKDRYSSLEGNRKKWNDELSDEENREKVGLIGWGFVPGLPLEHGKDYSDDLETVPEKNKEKVRKAEEFVYKHCAKKQKKEEAKPDGEEKKEEEKEEPIPFEWQTAYEMKPWVDWPDRL